MKPTIKQCKKCKKEFETDNRKRKYCTNECAWQARTLMHRETCRESKRRRSGTYDKWMMKLIKAGYIVIAPTAQTDVKIQVVSN